MKDHQLISLAQDGHQEAIAALYEKYIDAIYRFCYWQTNQNTEVAEDLTHDTFVEMAKSIGKFNKQGKFKNWLYTIAKRQLAAWMRQKYNLPKEPLFDNIAQPEESIDPEKQEKAIKKVEKLLEQLSDTERSVIVLRYLKNYSVKETAQELGLSISNVKVTAHRAIKKLREMSL